MQPGIIYEKGVNYVAGINARGNDKETWMVMALIEGRNRRHGPLAQGRFKLNCDGASCERTDHYGAGSVL